MVPEGRPRVVIVGGGFGGLYAARALRSAPVDVLVVDRRNHHLFQPLLYQVATAGLTGPHIAGPIREVLRRQRNAEVRMAEVTAVDTANRRVVLAEGELPYDYLLLAPGMTHTYFGNEGWAKHAPGLKTLADAMEIRSRILLAYEAAEGESDAQRQAEWLSFVIIGAGPTGVELAGALAEMARHTLSRDFRNFDPRTTRILLLEGGARVLPGFPPELSRKARAQLERLGVTVRTETRVTGIDAAGVQLGDERVSARTVLWSAGVRAAPITATLGAPLDGTGRVLVEPDLSLPGEPRVFVIGDAARVEQDGQPVPGVAPAAIQEGRHVAKSIRRALRGEPALPFRYRDKGSLATIGRAAAVADFGRVRFSGWLAWVLWLAVHIVFIIGFRSRLILLFEWAWAWCTFRRTARVVSDEATAGSPE